MKKNELVEKSMYIFNGKEFEQVKFMGTVNKDIFTYVRTDEYTEEILTSQFKDNVLNGECTVTTEGRGYSSKLSGHVVNGYKDGHERKWDSNGESVLTYYDNGKENGVSTRIYPNGTTSSKCMYVQGIEMMTTHYEHMKITGMTLTEEGVKHATICDSVCRYFNDLASSYYVNNQ